MAVFYLTGRRRRRINVATEEMHPRQIAFRERMRAPVVGSRPVRRSVGCYECCRGPGSPSRSKWERLCTVCHRLTRGWSCCGYSTVEKNPRIRVPRIGSNRWKVFLKKFPQFEFKESRAIRPTHDWGTTKQDCDRGNIWACDYCGRIITTVEENFEEVMESDEICPKRRIK
jgi:hypothetical protein